MPSTLKKLDKIMQKPKGRWTEYHKRQVAYILILGGTRSQAASITGIPFTTLGDWIESPDWPNFIQSVRLADAYKLSELTQSAITLAAQQLTDRLTNGDEKLFLVKDPDSGEQSVITRRQLMSGKDCALAMKLAVDSQRLLRDSVAPVEKNIVDRFQKLADALEARGLRQLPPVAEVSANGGPPPVAPGQQQGGEGKSVAVESGSDTGTEILQATKGRNVLATEVTEGVTEDTERIELDIPTFITKE